LKFLPAEQISDAERKRRFIREARAASALNHPNIVTVYEIDACEGVDFIAMEYVAGRTLSQVVADKPLAVEDALRYAAQIADALAAAHKAGIVHRDVKPGNLMVTEDGRVKVLDFGLAKLTEVAPAGVEATLTLLAGTPAYMAPEQAEGRAADARTDIYAFGAVLYEMLAGRRAFAGLAREEPPPPKEAPAELCQVVARCLRRDPAERYQNAAELKAALEKASIEPEQAPSIAVLPFVNMSGDKENEYFSDGLAEEIINALTKVPGLRVAARTSSFSYRGRDLDVRKVGAELTVGHLLEGSVRKAGERLRVTAQLISVADGYHVWSERFDRRMADIFDIQDEISQAIVDRLRVELAGNAPLVKRQTADLEAYNLYLRGRYWWHETTAQSWRKAEECFRNALVRDPAFAPPHAGMAVAYTYLAIHGWARPRDAMPAARRHALQALALDQTLAQGHWALAYVYQWYEWDWQAAEEEYRRALSLSPGDAHIRMVHAGLLMFLGRTADALAEARKALELDPVSAEVSRLMTYIFLLARRYGDAVAHGLQALELHPQGTGLYSALGLAYGHQGRYDLALQSLLKAKSLAGEDPYHDWALGYVYARQGNRDEAWAIRKRLERRRRESHYSATFLAALSGALDDLDQAFDWLEIACDERDSFLVALRADPLFDPLRADARFAGLLRRVGLEGEE
jgi:serine/threonine-protein kinase